MGVTVHVTGTHSIAVTDAGGRYQLGGTWERGTEIVFSYIGYATKRIKYDGRKQRNVKLFENAKNLGEVVINAKSNINAID